MEDNRILIRSKRRRRLSVWREAADLTALAGALPEGDEEYKIVSFCRVSSVAFLRWVASQTVIHELTLSTFRIGPRALKLLSGLHAQGRLARARFVVGRLASSQHSKNNERTYFERLAAMCQRNSWRVCSINNHIKIMLFDTAVGRYILEGSSNLNDAPNWEQYTFQQDRALYEFYGRVFDEMFAFAGREERLDLPAEETVEPGLTFPTIPEIWR